jgi:hypothetical protein
MKAPIAQTKNMPQIVKKVKYMDENESDND